MFQNYVPSAGNAQSKAILVCCLRQFHLWYVDEKATKRRDESEANDELLDCMDRDELNDFNTLSMDKIQRNQRRFKQH